jgi:hypothetical protein
MAYSNSSNELFLGSQGVAMKLKWHVLIDVAYRFVAAQRSWKNGRCCDSGFLINGAMQPVAGWRERIPAETVSIREYTAFSKWSLQRGYLEDNWGDQVSSVRESVKKGVSLKGAAIQRKLERGSWRISTVRSRYQGTADEDTADWKRACAVVICKLWWLATAL